MNRLCWIKINICMLSLSLFLFSPFLAAKEPIVVGSKAFTESYILGEIVAILLEEVFSEQVERKLGLGGTQVAFSALEQGDIHVYPEYTGTGYTAILGMKGRVLSSEVHKAVSQIFNDKWGIQWSQPIGFNNTYALAVRKDDPFFKDVQSLSQLSSMNLGEKKYAANHEFMERKDGHFYFIDRYQINLKADNIISLEEGLMYAAIRDRALDMIIAYSTDGRIKAYNLRILKDDNSFFPPYDAALIAKGDNLKENSSLRKVFEMFKGLITEEEMVYMNDQVDQGGGSQGTWLGVFSRKKEC